MESKCSKLRFSWWNEQKERRRHVHATLVHARTLFFFLFLLSLPPPSLLSSSLLSSFSVMFGVRYVCGYVWCGVARWKNGVSPDKMPPCVRSKRPRVYRHHAHMLKHMCAWCRCTRGAFWTCHTTPHTHTPRPQPQPPLQTPHGDRDSLAVYPRLFWTTSTFRADVATIMRVMVSPVVQPRLFWISHHIDIQSTARQSHCVNTIWDHRKNKTQRDVEDYVLKWADQACVYLSSTRKCFSSILFSHILDSYVFFLFFVQPGHHRTIQYLIPGRATKVELLKQVKNWQSPSRDPWWNCLINSRETTKGQTKYDSGRQKDNSKTICNPPRYVSIKQ